MIDIVNAHAVFKCVTFSQLKGVSVALDAQMQCPILHIAFPEASDARMAAFKLADILLQRQCACQI